MTIRERYEKETGMEPTKIVGDHWIHEEVFTDEYVEYLEAMLEVDDDTETV
jgi:hypothetical protein